MKQQTLDVGIIGAGIAGLATALALRRAGHRTELFERSSFKNEVGAAITLTPNANLILERWGYDFVKTHETKKQQSRRVYADTLEMYRHHDFTDVPQKYGHSFNAFHRVDMHNEMRRLALSEDGPGETPVLKLGSKAADIDCDAGIIVLENGERVQKDMIVVADGINSGFIKQICGDDVPLKQLGVSVYRTLIPMSKLRQDPNIWPVAFQTADGKDQPSGFFNAIDSKRGTMVITYPCQSDEVMNVAVFHKTKPHQSQMEGWNSVTSFDDVYSAVDHLNPVYPAIVKHADTWKCFNLSIRDPLPKVVNGKAVIIGDAAHPMQPTHAQGGCMCLEDAAAFEVLFSEFGLDESVGDRLQIYSQLRYARGAVTQMLSNAMFMSGRSDELLAKIRSLYQGPVPHWNTDGWDDEVRQMYYGYDIFAEAETAKKYQDEPDGVPQGALEIFGLKA